MQMEHVWNYPDKYTAHEKRVHVELSPDSRALLVTETAAPRTGVQTFFWFSSILILLYGLLSFPIALFLFVVGTIVLIRDYDSTTGLVFILYGLFSLWCIPLGEQIERSLPARAVVSRGHVPLLLTDGSFDAITPEMLTTLNEIGKSDLKAQLPRVLTVLEEDGPNAFNKEVAKLKKRLDNREKRKAKELEKKKARR